MERGKRHGVLGLTVAFAIAAGTCQADTQQSALLTLAQKLECVQTEQEAAVLLKELTALSSQPFGIPSENLKAEQHALLYAASVDILLQVLYNTLQRYPSLQEAAEIPVLQWNYCQMLANGKIHDLILDKDGHVSQLEAIDPFPLKKNGFGIWGFLSTDPHNRYIPKTLQDTAIWPRLQEELVFRLYQQQCFPHPDTGKLYEEDNRSGLPAYGELQTRDEATPSSHPYPYQWQAKCQPDQQANQSLSKITRAEQTARLSKAKNPSVPTRQAAKPSSAKTNLSGIGSGVKKPASVANPIILPAPPLPSYNQQIAQAQIPSTPIPPKTSKPASKPKPAKETKPAKITLLKIALDTYEPPPKQEAETVSPGLGSANANASAPLPLPSKNGYGLAGNFYHRAKLTGAMAVGGNISWQPFSHFSVRGGANYGYYPGDGQFSYAWGIGYDDWHPGTFSLQLNNWGPILPKDGLGFDKASLNLGYKFVADFLKPYHLNGSAAVTLPIKGDPSISTTWVWSPVEHWFIRAGLQKNLLSSDGLNWSYGFGYADSRPFKFSLTYDNWGVNPIIGGDSKSNMFNFQENGAITLSWSWVY